MSGCDGFPPGGRAECGWMMIHRRRKAFGWVPCLHSPFPVVGLGLICLGGVPRLHSPFPVCGDWLVSLGSTLCCLVGRCPTPCRWRCPRTPARELTPWTPRRCAANWRFALFHYSLFTIHYFSSAHSFSTSVWVFASGSFPSSTICTASSRRIYSTSRNSSSSGWLVPSF